MQRAAEALHLTPPAVSMQVKETRGAGRPAAVRPRGPPVSLSTAGEYFLVHAAAAGGAEGGRRRDGTLQALEHGRLTIGMVSTAKYFVPQLLARFHARAPGRGRAAAVAGNREQLVALLQAGEVDLAVMGRPPKRAGHAQRGLRRAPAWSSSARPTTRCWRVGHAPVTALAPYPFIVREQGSGTRNAHAAVLCRTPLRAQHHDGDLEQRDHQAGRDRRHGPGLPVTAHGGAGAAQPACWQLLEIEGTPVMRTWNVVHLQSRTLSPRPRPSATS
jgi:DNA-binding transcriptional LysR family regulator